MKFLVYSGSEQQSSESCIRFSLSKKHQLQKTLPHTVRMAPYSVRSFLFIETAYAPELRLPPCKQMSFEEKLEALDCIQLI